MDSIHQAQKSPSACRASGHSLCGRRLSEAIRIGISPCPGKELTHAMNGGHRAELPIIYQDYSRRTDHDFFVLYSKTSISALAHIKPRIDLRCDHPKITRDVRRSDVCLTRVFDLALRLRCGYPSCWRSAKRPGAVIIGAFGTSRPPVAWCLAQCCGAPRDSGREEAGGGRRYEPRYVRPPIDREVSRPT